MVNVPELGRTENNQPVIRAQNYGMKRWVGGEDRTYIRWEEIEAGLQHPESFFARLSGTELVRYDIDEEKRDRLEHFFANRNYLQFIPFRHLENVRTLDVSNTQIVDVPTLPPHLRILAISNTGVSQLPEFPDTLRILKASGAQLRELPDVPEGMLKISVRYNRLRTLPFESIQRCQNLRELRYDGNPYEGVFPEDFLRWLELQFQRVYGDEENQRKIDMFRLERKGGRENRLNRMDVAYQRIYRNTVGNEGDDVIGATVRLVDVKPVVPTISQSGQNVHDRRILDQLKRAYHILGKDTTPLKWGNNMEYVMGLSHQEILLNLWEILKGLLEKSGDSVRGTTEDRDCWERLWKSRDETTSGLMNMDGSFHRGITLARTMGYVFGWYVKNKPLEEWGDLMEILAGEWVEWKTVCMTGRLMRCVNLLSGIHPEFKVEVPIGEQIQQKYNYLYKKYAPRFPPEDWLEQSYRILQYYDESIYLWRDFARRFREALEEIQLEEGVIGEWVTPLEENAVELEKEMKEKYPDEYQRLEEKREADRLNALRSQKDYEERNQEREDETNEE